MLIWRSILDRTRRREDIRFRWVRDFELSARLGMTTNSCMLPWTAHARHVLIFRWLQQGNSIADRYLGFVTPVLGIQRAQFRCRYQNNCAAFQDSWFSRRQEISDYPCDIR